MLSIIKEDKENNRAFTDLNFICDVEDVGKKLVKELELKKLKYYTPMDYKMTNIFTKKKKNGFLERACNC